VAVTTAFHPVKTVGTVDGTAAPVVLAAPVVVFLAPVVVFEVPVVVFLVPVVVLAAALVTSASLITRPLGATVNKVLIWPLGGRGSLKAHLTTLEANVQTLSEWFLNW